MTISTRRFFRLAVPVTAAVALSGAAGAALAANIDTPASNAGQGVGTVDGFTVTAVAYSTDSTNSNDENATVDAVAFEIERDGQATEVDDANAEVWIQLRSGATLSDWASCTVDEGEATCDTGELDVTMADLSEISIIAYDV